MEWLLYNTDRNTIISHRGSTDRGGREEIRKRQLKIKQKYTREIMHLVRPFMDESDAAHKEFSDLFKIQMKS